MNQTRGRRTLKIKQRDERRTRDFWEFRLEELQETEPKKIRKEEARRFEMSFEKALRIDLKAERLLDTIFLESLILAQDERWRRA